MQEELIVQLCSPTLAGLKTGSLFSCPYQSERELADDVRRLNRRLAPKGVRVLVLRVRRRALIYLYRPSSLKKDLADDAAAALLKGFGYSVDSAERCVVQLIERLRTSPDFPHEIGLFLGYPPEDVRGFIENKAQDCKCVGCWKVYGDEQRARDLFVKYQRCTEIYCERLHAGSSIAQLAVNVQQRNTAQKERMLPS